MMMTQISEQDNIAEIRKARGKFAAMVSTYGLGVFNDNFFRTAVILMAGAGDEGWIMAIFMVPFILFASSAGWMADRYSKRRIVILTKALEVVAMLCGAAGIVNGNWVLIGIMVFLMAAQSCLFSPALNGSIPELYPANYVSRANAKLKVIVTMMILAGVAVSGPVLQAGRGIVAFSVIGIAIVGFLISFLVPYRPAADPKASFPWRGPVDTILELVRIRKDKLLWTVVVADCFVWFAGAMIILLIKALGKDQLGLKESVTSYMVASQTVGVAVGGILSSYLSRGKTWHRVLVPGAVGMGLVVCAVSTIPFFPKNMVLPVLYTLFTLSGVFGGLYMIPCEAYIQIRPETGRKGTVIASANFAIFFCMLIASILETALVKNMSPDQFHLCFSVVGGLSLLMAGWLAFRNRYFKEENNV